MDKNMNAFLAECCKNIVEDQAVHDQVRHWAKNIKESIELMSLTIDELQAQRIIDTAAIGTLQCQLRALKGRNPGDPIDDRPQVTPAEAEKLALKFVGAYLTECRITDESRVDVGNCLMMLGSVVGVTMARAEGSEIACQRLTGTALMVKRVMPEYPSEISPVH